MGRDKALIELGGQTLIERALLSLATVCDEVAIVGGSPDLARFARLIPDLQPKSGPLGGIVSALEQSTQEWNLILAVDVPFVPLSVWSLLLNWADGSSALAVLPEVDGRTQPLCGVYSRLCAPILRRQLESGNLRVLSAFDSLQPVHLMRFTETRWFRNLNTPADLASVP